MTDYRSGTTVTATNELTLAIYKASGNGAFLITPASSEDYTVTEDSLIPAITVDSGVSSFMDFEVAISEVLGNDGNEKILFIQVRDNAQINIVGITGNFDGGVTASACFNVQGGRCYKDIYCG